MNIAIIYSLPTRRALLSGFATTDEDTKISAQEVAEALTEKGTDCTLIPISEDTIGSIATVKADVIVNLIEWDGLDLSLTDRAMQILESLGIAFTGSNRKSVLLANDKQTMKTRLEESHLPTPAWQIFAHGDETISHDLPYPAIVKLVLEHCSIGLSSFALVSNERNLRKQVKERQEKFHQAVLVEEYIEGREFQVTLLEDSRKVLMLPPAEIVFHRKNNQPTFLTYESRWTPEHPEYDASTVDVAMLSDHQVKYLEEICVKAFRAFSFRDYSRIDIRMRDDEFFILEANANPGLGDDEDYGMTVSYKAAGMTFADFVWEIVNSALTAQAGLRK